MMKPRSSSRRIRTIGLALAALLLLPVPVRADDMEIAVGPVEIVAGAVCVTYRVDRPFTPRLTETLELGMPATVSFEVGLWKRRAFWFDKLVLAIKSEHKVVYDEWAKSYRIRTGASPPRSSAVASLEAVRGALFQAYRLPVASVAALDTSGSYYVSVRATIRPVAAEDIGEIEDWLAGESPGPEGEARGVPGYLMDLAVNLSGLGDRTDLEKSERFRPARLAAAPPFARP
ncbi:MAG TPA: DUF4390 domain-containing protein [Candidatus Eisenbacteria bacterium]|nr:DUF4390 domain-containing protein [Candidatus Eisenbacteria bacterium]